MIRGGIRVMALALGLGAAGTAAAQENKQGDLKVFLKGGVSDYTGDVGSDVESGPAWGLTVNVQPMRMIGFELGYEGSKNDIETGPLDASLTRHGASGLVKLAPPFIEKVKPFVGAGLGASYIAVNGTALGLYESDLVEEVPLAAGIEFNTGAVTAGVRATYRLLVDESFAANTEPGNPQGGLFDASFTLGGRF